jgi:hypothetical protein
MSLERFIRFIKEGEPVSPGTPNRPLRELDQNIQYLWDIIQAAELGSTVYAREVTIESDTQIGMPVYWNAQESRFDRAIAGSQTDATTGYLVMTDSSQVWGIVALKHSSTKADLLLFGYAEIDISPATGSTGGVPAGTYFLSGIGLGELTLQEPPVSVPVLRADGTGNVFVNPSFMNSLGNHQHYKFDLVMLPAGNTSPPAEGNKHVITDANSLLTGWLPADDAIFDGNAPAGAEFGYNISADFGLNNTWPPIPVQSVDVELVRPSIYDSADLKLREKLAGQVLGDIVKVDSNGIWWMTNCYDQVPWPTDYTTGDSLSYSMDTCPQEAIPAMLLYFVKVNFATDISVVSSIKSLDDRLKIYCSGTTTVESVGDLDIDLDLNFVVGADDTSGYLAFKELDGNDFKRGPIAEGVYSKTSNVSLTGDASKSVTIDSVARTVWYGNVGVSVLDTDTQELKSQLVRLDGVTEEHNPLLYLGFPNDVASSFVVKFEVPADAPDNSDFQYRPRFIGRVSGTLPTTPELTIEYKIAVRPGIAAAGEAGAQTVATVPTATTWTAIGNTVTTASISANHAVEVLTAASEVTVQPGDVVYIKVSRTNPSGDGYVGEFGVMQQNGIIS